MSDTATDRALLLLSRINMAELAEPRTKEYDRWQNIKRGRARFGIEEAGILASKYPQYSMWLLTGKTDIDGGQTSPDLEEIQRSESGTQSAG